MKHKLSRLISEELKSMTMIGIIALIILILFLSSSSCVLDLPKKASEVKVPDIILTPADTLKSLASPDTLWVSNLAERYPI